MVLTWASATGRSGGREKNSFRTWGELILRCQREAFSCSVGVFTE